jgi:fatty acyl-CoA reductase
MKNSVEHQVSLIQGDITETGLGLSAQNREELCREVSIVFHVAATVRFNDNLKVALKTNVIGTQEIVNVCKDMSHLAVSQFKHIWKSRALQYAMLSNM